MWERGGGGPEWFSGSEKALIMTVLPQVDMLQGNEIIERERNPQNLGGMGGSQDGEAGRWQASPAS